MTNTRASELQSFRASELRTQRYENTEHCESQQKAIFAHRKPFLTLFDTPSKIL